MQTRSGEFMVIGPFDAAEVRFGCRISPFLLKIEKEN
jgi:hypothetical protein